jgi:hypothetical protein
MYLLTDLAKATHHEKLQAAARDQLRGRAYAARRAGNRGSSARRLADLVVLHILRGRRAARAY